MSEKYKKYFELYGSQTVVAMTGCTASTVSVYAKRHKWKTPTAAEAGKNIAKLIMGI